MSVSDHPDARWETPMPTPSFRIEETTEFLIAFSGAKPLTGAEYQRVLRRWGERLDEGERFGVVLVYEPYERDPDAPRDPSVEEDRSQALAAFRRDHRRRANVRTCGFARVFFPGLVSEMGEAARARFEERSARMAAYMFGVRGRDFFSLEDAMRWLRNVRDEAPLDLGDDEPEARTGEIGLFYGSTTGTTERIAERMQVLAAHLGVQLSLVNVAGLKDPASMLRFRHLILGVSTWNVGQLQDDWRVLFPRLDGIDFGGMRVALFGIGDQVGYPANYLDALGILAKKLRERNASVVGAWPTAGYDFAASAAADGDAFVGLGIDDLNQEHLNDARIEAWLRCVFQAFEVRVSEGRRPAEALTPSEPRGTAGR